MILIDTSIWIQVFKDKKGTEAQRIQIGWMNMK
jgi:predicted nucleic acid-binding protein